MGALHLVPALLYCRNDKSFVFLVSLCQVNAAREPLNVPMGRKIARLSKYCKDQESTTEDSYQDHMLATIDLWREKDTLMVTSQTSLSAGELKAGNLLWRWESHDGTWVVRVVKAYSAISTRLRDEIDASGYRACAASGRSPAIHLPHERSRGFV